MNFLRFLLISFILVPLGLFGQEEFSTDYMIHYEVVYSLDSLNRDQKKTEDIYEFSNSEQGVFVNFNQAYEKEVREGVVYFYKDGYRVATNVAWRSTNFKINFYKDLRNQEVTVVSDIAGISFRYSEPEKLVWNIEDSTRTVSDFLVQKATTRFAGRDYIAWFTTEIPIPDGPYVFHGLPGLIVEIYDTKDDYHFTLKSLGKLEEPRVWEIDSDITQVSKSRFKELRRKRERNRDEVKELFTPQGGETSVVVMVNGEEVTENEYRRLVSKGKINSKNNPIELE